MQRLLQEAGVAMTIGQAAYDAREAAGLTQEQLAERLGMTAEEIEDLEMGDFAGDALALLHHVAVALGRQVELRLVAADPNAPKRRTA